MKIGVFGTGVVGQTIASKLDELGHDVMLGTRDVAETLARAEPNPYGMPPLAVWHAQNPRIKLGTFAEAAEHGGVLFNATNGAASVQALESAGEANLGNKVLMDISNPLDFSRGMPPTLTVSNTDSMGEQIQRAFPNLKVVKTLNTVTASLMVNPNLVGGGEHDMFVCGNDADANAQATEMLKSWFGWKRVIDLGDITAARGMEMYLPIWLRLWGALGTGVFNIKVVS